MRILILATLILTLSSCVGAATEHTVNSGDSIQAVVTNASSGDIITIGSGTFTEDILIEGKTDLLIRSLEGPASTVIAATAGAAQNNSTKNMITIKNCNNITIQGLNITGAGLDNSGIYINQADNCKVENNIMHDDALGISLVSSNGAVIRNNIATKNLFAGLGRAVILQNSNYATISGNIISNQKYGIYVSGSVGNAISGNTITQSASDSILVQNSANNNVIENNTVSSSGSNGIYLSSSGGNILNENEVSNSNTNGIYLYWSSGNTLSDNTVNFGSVHDIMMDNSSDNTLTNNIISNSPYGIAVRFSNNNILTGNNATKTTTGGLYITLTSTNNTLSGNKANSNNGPGISLYQVSGNIVENNEVKSNTGYSGILLDGSSNNQVSNNNASGNGRGIYVTASSSGNTLSGNTLKSNTGDGIRLENAGSNNKITSNNASSNGNYGIYLVTSNYTSLLNNVASSNSKGIYLLSSSWNIISNNTVFNNNVDVANSNGIMLSLSTHNEITRNMAYRNPYGISFNSSQNNNASSNRVYLNTKAGMFLCARSTSNLIFNNYFNNSQNTDNNNTGCTWYTAKTPGRNIVNGPNLGGNYWADPFQYNDHSQVYASNDADGDGIIDIPYSADEVTDNLPLIYYAVPEASFTTNVTSGNAPLTVLFTDTSKDAVSRAWDFNNDGVNDSTDASFVYTYTSAGTYTAKLTAINANGTDEEIAVISVSGISSPVADFSASVTSGNAPLQVTFTDLSQNATEWSWDFGNGATSTDQSPTYTYSAAGTYTVKLTARNIVGTNEKTLQIIVNEVVNEVEDDSGSSGGSSHSSGGSGGGGGGSPEPARNVEVKELSQAFITNGKAVQFDFTKNATCVVSVGFDAKKTVGKTTTIVEQLKNKSTLVSPLSEGEVYKYFNVWVGNSGFASSSNIGNPTICFKVAKSWTQDKNIDQNSITLNRYSNKTWEQLPVSLSGEDSKYLYYAANVPGYTFFAITGKANTSTETVTETESGNEPENSENNTGNTEAETGNESNEGENKSMPGFEMVCGIVGLSAVFLYKRK